jgi:hypothetical protein
MNTTHRKEPGKQEAVRRQKHPLIGTKRVIPNHELKSHEERDAQIQSDCPPQLDLQFVTPLNKQTLHNHISVVTSDFTKLILSRCTNRLD